MDSFIDFDSLTGTLELTDFDKVGADSATMTVVNGVSYIYTFGPNLSITRDSATKDDYIYLEPSIQDKSEDQAEDKPESDVSAPSMEERNALSTAHDYLNVSAFSYSGLINQLEYVGFSTESATYAVDNCGADWNEQAASWNGNTHRKDVEKHCSEII